MLLLWKSPGRRAGKPSLYVGLLFFWFRLQTRFLRWKLIPALIKFNYIQFKSQTELNQIPSFPACNLHQGTLAPVVVPPVAALHQCCQDVLHAFLLGWTEHAGFSSALPDVACVDWGAICRAIGGAGQDAQPCLRHPPPICHHLPGFPLIFHLHCSRDHQVFPLLRPHLWCCLPSKASPPQLLCFGVLQKLKLTELVESGSTCQWKLELRPPSGVNVAFEALRGNPQWLEQNSTHTSTL